MKHVCLIVFFGLFMLSACATPSGGGSALVEQKVVAYGIGGEGLTFVIFTNNPFQDIGVRAGGNSGLFSSQQYGELIHPPSGSTIDFFSDEITLKIEGAEYTLADGNVFLADVKDGNLLNIRQLDLTTQPTDLSTESFHAEVNRLKEEHDSIRTFIMNET